MKTFLLSLGAAFAIGFGAVSASKPSNSSFCEDVGVVSTNIATAKSLGIPFIDILANTVKSSLDSDAKDFVINLAFVIYHSPELEGLNPAVVGAIISAQCTNEQEAL